MIEKILMDAASKTLEKSAEAVNEVHTTPEFVDDRETDKGIGLKEADEVAFTGLNSLAKAAGELEKAAEPKLAEFADDIARAGAHVIPKFVDEIKTFVVNTFEQADELLSDGENKENQLNEVFEGQKTSDANFSGLGICGISCFDDLTSAHSRAVNS